VPFYDAWANTELSIWRRRGETAGGDPCFLLSHSSVPGFIDAVNEYTRRTVLGRERVITAKAILPPIDASGETLDLQGGDELRFTDYRGVSQQREVVSVRPIFLFGILDHIIVELA
jgi:hypothetical protein